jgi:type I site-specific restriction-modification system R (restriction) subunit
MAMKYYTEFKCQMPEKNRNLAVATIYSFSANEDDPEDALPDEGFDNDKLDKSSRDFLDAVIADYNRTFSVNFDTSADKFQNYYKENCSVFLRNISDWRNRERRRRTKCFVPAVCSKAYGHTWL